MITKSNNNSYYDGTSAFFNVFSEKDSHLNAIEHSDNRKNNFLVLGEGPTYGINRGFE